MSFQLGDVSQRSLIPRLCILMYSFPPPSSSSQKRQQSQSWIDWTEYPRVGQITNDHSKYEFELCEIEVSVKNLKSSIISPVHMRRETRRLFVSRGDMRECAWLQDIWNRQRFLLLDLHFKIWDEESMLQPFDFLTNQAPTSTEFHTLMSMDTLEHGSMENGI